MNSGGGPELDRPRRIGELLRDSFALLAGRPLAFLAVGFVFAVPIELAVSGVGLAMAREVGSCVPGNCAAR